MKSIDRLDAKQKGLGTRLVVSYLECVRLTRGPEEPHKIAESSTR